MLTNDQIKAYAVKGFNTSIEEYREQIKELQSSIDELESAMKDLLACNTREELEIAVGDNFMLTLEDFEKYCKEDES